MYHKNMYKSKIVNRLKKSSDKKNLWMGKTMKFNTKGIYVNRLDIKQTTNKIYVTKDYQSIKNTMLSKYF